MTRPSVGTGKGVERISAGGAVVSGSRRRRSRVVPVSREDAAEGGGEVAQLPRDGLPGGDGDLSVDEAGLVPGDGREEEGEVLGHDAVGQPGRQRGHDPENWRTRGGVYVDKMFWGTPVVDI